MNMHVMPSPAELDQARREIGWTELRTRVACALFNSGLSAAQCAGEMGNVTRNGVIGKIHRLGLADSGRKLSQFSNRKAKGVREKPLRPARISMTRAKKADEPPPPHVDDAAIAIEQRRSLLGLNDACCHWPVGDPGQQTFFFCGAVVRQKHGERYRPYCASHMRRAHQPAWQRRAGTENPKSKLRLALVNHDTRR